MNNSFCPEAQGTAANSARKTDSASNRFKISIELSSLKRHLTVTDHVTATEIHYSHNAAEELLNAIAGSLVKTGKTVEEIPWQKELTREERKMEHRVSEQKGGFATLEQLEAWGFNADAIAECLTTQQRKLLPLKPSSLSDRCLGRMTNRI